MIDPDTKVRLLDDVQELAEVIDAMRRAVNNRNELRLQDHIVRLHALNLRLATTIDFHLLQPFSAERT